MTKQELIERGFTTDRFNRVLDGWGNEYRNENGEVEFLESKVNREGVIEELKIKFIP